MRFLTTKQIAGEIERVIREARKRVILISPYLRVDHIYIGRIQESIKRGVNCRIVFQTGQEWKDPIAELADISGVELFSLDHLHAKCYVNESSAILTSMNLYAHSEQNNREMGLLVERREHEEVYEHILAECNSIVNTASRHNQADWWGQKSNSVVNGYCIRCRSTLDFDPGRPLCRQCYDEWARYQNEDYTERFCHACGRREPTAMSRPLCIVCYRQVSNSGF